MQKKLTTQKMAMIGMMSAFYVVLSAYVSLKLGNIRITFASVTTILMATLFGPLEGMLVAGLGEFINQMLSYGFSRTTLLWIMPPVFRACVVGLFAKALSSNGKKPEDNRILYPVSLVVAALLTTVVNTFVIYADSKIYGYYSYAYVFGATLTRFITGVVTALVVSAIIIAIIKPIRKVVSR